MCLKIYMYTAVIFSVEHRPWERGLILTCYFSNENNLKCDDTFILKILSRATLTKYFLEFSIEFSKDFLEIFTMVSVGFVIDCGLHERYMGTFRKILSSPNLSLILAIVSRVSVWTSHHFSFYFRFFNDIFRVNFLWWELSPPLELFQVSEILINARSG